MPTEYEVFVAFTPESLKQRVMEWLGVHPVMIVSTSCAMAHRAKEGNTPSAMFHMQTIFYERLDPIGATETKVAYGSRTY